MSNETPRVLCLLTDDPDESANVALMDALTAAVGKLDLPEPTPAQIARRAANHERLVRLGLKPA